MTAMTVRFTAQVPDAVLARAVATMPPQGPVWPDRDDDDRAVPVFPGPRRSPETEPPTPTPAPVPAGGWTR